MEPVLARVAQTVVPWDSAPQGLTTVDFCGTGESVTEDFSMGQESDAYDDSHCLLETDLDTNCTLRRRKYPVSFYGFLDGLMGFFKLL